MGYLGDQTSFAKEVRAFAAMIQQLEDTFFEIASMRVLSQAVGTQLDVLGELIGGGYAPRLGRSDVEYRAVLNAQCKINNTRGEPERLIAAIKALTGATTVHFREYHPLYMVITYLSDTVPEGLKSLMNRVKAGGVGMDIVRADPDTPFTLASGPTSETDADLGFSDLSQTTGGMLSELIT